MSLPIGDRNNNIKALLSQFSQHSHENILYSPSDRLCFCYLSANIWFTSICKEAIHSVVYSHLWFNGASYTRVHWADMSVSLTPASFPCFSWRRASGVLLRPMWEIQCHGYGAAGPQSGGPVWPLWPDLFTEDGLDDSHSAGEFRAETLPVSARVIEQTTLHRRRINYTRPSCRFNFHKRSLCTFGKEPYSSGSRRATRPSWRRALGQHS